MQYLKLLKLFVVSIAALFLPIKSLLFATGALIVLDLITGVMAARKRGEKITSGRLRDSLSKLVIYEVAICAAFVAEHYISDMLPFVKIASSMISLVELTSVYENLNDISGKDILKSLIVKLGSPNTNSDQP
jgi:fumarate reductase subunit D